MKTLYDLLGVHRDADNETLKWAFRRALAATRPDPTAGDADPFLQSVDSNGILRDPQQRMLCCRLVEWERERLQSKSRRVAAANAITASFAVLLGTIAVGYGLFASGASTAVVATAIDDGRVGAAAVIKKDGDISSTPAAARKDAVPLPAAPEITIDAGAWSDVGMKNADDPPAQKADDAPVPAAEPVKGAADASAPVPVKTADDTPAPEPEPVKKAEGAPALAAEPAKRTDDALPAVSALTKADDALTPAAAVKQAEGLSTPVGRPAETAAVQPALRADPDSQEATRSRREGLDGPDGKARRGADGPVTNGGDKVALGFRASETAFRNNAKYYRERGIASYRRGDFLQATSDLGEAIRLDRDDAQAFNIRGNVADEIGAFERALADYDEAIRLDSNNAGPLDDRAILWRRKGDLDKALIELDQAVRSGFADAKVYCDRGLIWYEKGSFDRATADFSQAIKLDAAFATAYIRRGALLHRNSEFNVAFTAVYPAIRVDPKILDASRRSTRRPAAQPAAPLAASPESRTGPADTRAAPAELP